MVVQGNGCTDNSADMAAVTGFTCAQVVQHSLCSLKILPPLCTCSCKGNSPKGGGHRRRKAQASGIQVNYTEAAACTLGR